MSDYYTSYLLQDYLPALATTVVTELGVALLFGLWYLRSLSAVVLVNLVTHPALHALLWVAFWGRGASVPLPVVLALEGAVLVSEAALLRWWLRLPTARAFTLSAAMNFASYLAGWLLAG